MLDRCQRSTPRPFYNYQSRKAEISIETLRRLKIAAHRLVDVGVHNYDQKTNLFQARIFECSITHCLFYIKYHQDHQVGLPSLHVDDMITGKHEFHAKIKRASEGINRRHAKGQVFEFLKTTLNLTPTEKNFEDILEFAFFTAKDGMSINQVPLTIARILMGPLQFRF